MTPRQSSGAALMGIAGWELFAGSTPPSLPVARLLHRIQSNRAIARMSRSPSVAVRAAAYPTRAGAPPGEGVATQAPATPADERRDAPSSLSCVIPCRNEAANLALLLPRLRAVLGQLSPEWEIVLVDDGSVDDTAMQLADWTAESGVRVLQLSRNFGKEAALSAGLAAAHGRVVVLMDADLQHPPELIVQMVEHWRRGAEVVYAVRESRRDETRLKRFGTGWFYALVNAGSRVQVPKDAGDFRLLDRVAVDALLDLPERNRFMKGLYAWIGFDTVALPYQPPPRASGRSHYNYLTLLRLSIDGLTAFTIWPLRAASVVGIVIALLGFGYGAWITFAYLIWGDAVSGWTTIVCGMALMLGFMLIALGVLGEYVGRIYEEVKARPLFVVRREFGRGLQKPADH